MTPLHPDLLQIPEPAERRHPEAAAAEFGEDQFQRLWRLPRLLRRAAVEDEDRSGEDVLAEVPRAEDGIVGGLESVDGKHRGEREARLVALHAA